MAIGFDGTNLEITLDSGVTEETVQEIYSRWKDWVKLSDNAKFPPAFRQLGGDPISTTTSLSVTTFLRTDFGWRIKPPEENIQVTLEGNMFPQDETDNMFIPTTGGFDTIIDLRTSANVFTVNTGGSGSASCPIWPHIVF